MRCLLLWITLALVPYTRLQAQTDSVKTLAPDSVQAVVVVPAQETIKTKSKTWPVALTVMAILVSSYLLYNVRSR